MFRRNLTRLSGVSAMGVYAPPARVDLEKWCQWTGNKWDKVQSVVGSSFRIPTHNENCYTMAASAVMRLILQNEIDPSRVGFLGLGTESSTDNSAGSVIVRGMVDHALESLNLPRLSRNCEVPEFKHACLGGVYALKCAARYTETDGKDRLAIVVASDIAEYALGSTGEQTQGAGSVAMLVEHNPKLFQLNLHQSGSASAYRGPDFRKPFKRHFMDGYNPTADLQVKIPDFPVFSGPYSTIAYLDEVTHAVEDMLHKLQQKPSDFYNDISALFFHRPYYMMPVQSMAFLYARGLARSHSEAHRAEFKALCQKAKVTEAAVTEELGHHPDLYASIEKGTVPDAYPATNALAKAVRADKQFSDLLARKMSLGTSTVAQFGNLYTAALPCWIAAGFEEAYERKLDLTGKPMVIVGYGSGDASEAIPVTVVPGWEGPASRLGVKNALEGAVDLTQEQYVGLHSGSLKDDVAAAVRKGEFVVDSIGQRNETAFQDIGIEYYKYIKA